MHSYQSHNKLQSVNQSSLSRTAEQSTMANVAPISPSNTGSAKDTSNKSWIDTIKGWFGISKTDAVQVCVPDSSVVDQQQTSDISPTQEDETSSMEDGDVEIMCIDQDLGRNGHILSQLNHEPLPTIDSNYYIKSYAHEEYQFRNTIRKDFKVYPMIVRANGRTKKVLAVYANFGSDIISFSPKLLEELGMTDTNEMYHVTLSSLDDKQTIPVNQKFNKISFESPPSTRSFYQNEAERLWPHLFGPGQLSSQDELVHIQLTESMAQAFECSALTTAEFCKLPTCDVCHYSRIPAMHKQPKFHNSKIRRDRDFSDPKEDYYWLMDKQTYITLSRCQDRRQSIITKYDKRMAKRDKFIKSRKYIEIAIVPEELSFFQLLCVCCIPPIDNGK